MIGLLTHSHSRPATAKLPALGIALAFLLGAGPAAAADDPTHKLDAEWVLERLSKVGTPKLAGAVVNRLIDTDLLEVPGGATMDKINALDCPNAAEEAALAKAVERQLKLLSQASSAEAKAKAPKRADLAKRDTLEEDRLPYVAAKEAGKAATWRAEPAEYPADGDAAAKEKWKREHAQSRRISFAARAGYEVTHLPGEGDDNGTFFGVRYYSENVARFGHWRWWEVPDPQSSSKWDRPNRVDEVDIFFDLNYRTADVDAGAEGEGGKTLDNVTAVNFVGGVYTPFTADFPRGLLLDFYDGNGKGWTEARGEAGLLFVGGIKAIIDNEDTEGKDSSDYQKFVAAGLRLGTFLPDQPDPVRTIDFLFGARTDFNNPRFRIESHYLLYEFSPAKEGGSSVNLYGFGNVEIDLKKDGANAQDSLVFGVYLRYEFDRLKDAFGAVMP